MTKFAAAFADVVARRRNLNCFKWIGWWTRHDHNSSRSTKFISLLCLLGLVILLWLTTTNIDCECAREEKSSCFPINLLCCTICMRMRQLRIIWAEAVLNFSLFCVFFFLFDDDSRVDEITIIMESSEIFFQHFSFPTCENWYIKCKCSSQASFVAFGCCFHSRHIFVRLKEMKIYWHRKLKFSMSKRKQTSAFFSRLWARELFTFTKTDQRHTTGKRRKIISLVRAIITFQTLTSWKRRWRFSFTEPAQDDGKRWKI